jgi:N-acetylmuramoyl-L-alanine amidase-like protein
MSGLLIDGIEVVVSGLRIFNHNDHPWCRLSAADYKPRSTLWVRQVIAHSTLGKWLQPKRSGAGPGIRARDTAEFWRKDPTHSGAHLLVENNGDVYCFADLKRHCAYHATTSNDFSVGIEMRQESDGAIYEAVYGAMAKLVPAICRELSIPFQIASDPYVPGQIISRMLHGGSDCVGIFGHRDQSWVFPNQLDVQTRMRYPNGYAGRGRGDPGDDIYLRLRTAGAEPFYFGAFQDLATWKRRQRILNQQGASLKVDGIAGPGTIRAMRALGYQDGRDICP